MRRHERVEIRVSTMRLADMVRKIVRLELELEAATKACEEMYPVEMRRQLEHEMKVAREEIAAVERERDRLAKDNEYMRTRLILSL